MKIPDSNRIYPGDCLEVMKAWPDAFVQTCVTSPPYWGLRDYGIAGQAGMEKSPQDYVAKIVKVFREVRRVLRNDGTLWLNLGDSYTSGGRSTFGTWQPTAKQSTHRAIKDAKRAPQPKGLKPKDLVGIPWLVAFALQADGWYLRSDIIWSKPNPMPESVTDRPTKAHEYMFLLAKSERYYYDATAIKEKASYPDGANSPESIKSPYGQGFTRVNQRKPSGWNDGPTSDDRIGRYKTLPDGQINIRIKRDKQRGHGRRHDGFNDRWDQMDRQGQCSGMRNKRSVWTVATCPFPEAHFATFPPELIKPCILAGSAGGGIVLDPFMGAGTTALVASQYGRQFLGIEMNPEYVAMAEKRIDPEVSQMKIAL